MSAVDNSKKTKVDPKANQSVKSKLADEVKSEPKTQARPSLLEKLSTPLNAVVGRSRDLLSRRPHRSLRLTRRRDYTRSLDLPGYWSFTNNVRSLLWSQKRIFGSAILVFTLFTIVLVGMNSQDTYSQVSDALRDSGNQVFDGNWSELGQAGTLLLTSVTSSLDSITTEAKQAYASILALLLWLSTVWLLRSILSGGRPKLRDGLYSSGSPFVSTALVAIILVFQLIPVALAAVGYVAADGSGILDGGADTMLFWVAASLLATLSLYWITSTFIALVVVTLPGMYPMRAIRIAGDLAVGRRLRILLRLLWLGLTIVAAWAVIAIPIVIFDAWIKGILPILNWMPIVPLMIVLLGTTTMIWASSYIYLLYRKVVDDDAAPA